MSWLKPEVAQAQMKLVQEELMSFPWPNTYQVFVRCIETIGTEYIRSLLDAGCGCGHYGAICRKEWPNINYTGTDVSEHMIKQAIKLVPDGKFAVKEFFQNEFNSFDVCFFRC